MAKYKGITFAKGYNRSFADFKDEFGSTHVFKRLKPQDKERELKIAFKIANPNGNLTTAVRESKPTKRKRNK